MISRENGFETRFIHMMSLDIEAGNSFEEVAYKYNQLNPSECKISKTRFEEAYFLHSLKQFFEESLITKRESVSKVRYRKPL